LAPRNVLVRHALKNASLPVVTIIGIGFALLIGGAVVTESVFALPGLGRLTVDAIVRRDYPVIQGVLLVVSGIYVSTRGYVISGGPDMARSSSWGPRDGPQSPRVARGTPAKPWRPSTP
jgi:hypothetical protein